VVLWWIGNAVLLLAVVPLVVFLAHRIIRTGNEITEYADDILVHGLAVADNLEHVPALLDTKDLVRTATGHAVRYVDALRPIVQE
jgi:hypothetical protein